MVQTATSCGFSVTWGFMWSTCLTRDRYSGHPFCASVLVLPSALGLGQRPHLHLASLAPPHSQATRVLNYQRNSLAYLLKKFCDLKVDKSFQAADWRIRCVVACDVEGGIVARRFTPPYFLPPFSAPTDRSPKRWRTMLARTPTTFCTFTIV